MTDNVIQLPSAARESSALDQWREAVASVDAEPVKVSQAPAETPPSVRTIARQQDIDVASLISILEWMRPDGSNAEELFVETYLDMIDGMQKDGYGNRYITIGENPIVVWSCHTDTVSRIEGRQNVKWDGDFLVLNQPKSGQCLGADDGAGIWLMLEMIKAGRPGLYIFHRAEEVGCKGSKWLIDNVKESKLLDGIKMAIALDRADVDNVITHQSTGRCCSDEFAKSLAAELNQVPGLKYEPDPTGVYTDTAHYIYDVGECTNLSVGYYSQHGTSERLDVRHMLRLREALLQLDVTKLTLKREPGEEDDDDYYGGRWGGSYGGGWGGSRYSSSYSSRQKEPKTEQERIEKIVRDRPLTIAKILYNMGLSSEALEDMCVSVYLRSQPAKSVQSTKSEDDDWNDKVTAYLSNTGSADRDLAGEEDDEPLCEERLYCHSCQDWCDERYIFDHTGGEECPTCYGTDTEVYEAEVCQSSGEVLQ